jgi:hypothetical protein
MDDSGNPIATATTQIMVAAGAHTAFVLTDKFPEVRGKRGTAQLNSNVPIYGLGIRFNGTDFTSIGALSNVPAGNKILSHLANGGLSAGGQWSTTILLVNADTHTASYQVNFHKEQDGSPLLLPVLTLGPQSSVSGMLAPGDLAVIQTDGSGSETVEGWAELVTADAIGGTGIFTDLGSNGSRQEAAVPLDSSAGMQLFIPFDETSGNVVFATGIALTNAGASQANVNVSFTDDSGNKIPTPATQVIVGAAGHTAFVLMDKFPEVHGKRGTAQLNSNVPIHGLAIRFNGTAFTSIGAIVP